jgi:hypothetical protein
MIHYPAVYRDKHGEEVTVIENNGRTLSMTVRGVTFAGEDFDSLEPIDSVNDTQLATFVLSHSNDLCDCEIKCDVPIMVVMNGRQTLITLHTHLLLGAPRPTGGIDREELSLSLNLGDQPITTKESHGFYETALLEMRQNLPDSVYLKCCFTCAFSDYHPGGNGLFGDLACFRDNKEACLQAESKSDILQIWDTMTEWVQETYLCDEFEQSVQGTGYRGWI